MELIYRHHHSDFQKYLEKEWVQYPDLKDIVHRDMVSEFYTDRVNDYLRDEPWKKVWEKLDIKDDLPCDLHEGLEVRREEYPGYYYLCQLEGIDTRACYDCWDCLCIEDGLTAPLEAKELDKYSKEVIRKIGTIYQAIE